MADRRTARNEPATVDAAADSVMTSMERRMRQRRNDQRGFAVLIVLLALVLSGFYGAFQWVDGLSVDADLRLSADARAPVGEDVLVYAEVVDARSGQQRVLPNVYLEVWEGATRIDRLPVHGARYHRVPVTEAAQNGAQEIRLSRSMGGPVQSEAALKVSAGTAALARERRGGMYAPVAEPGLRPIRREDACGWTVDIVARGGVPIANIPTEMLLRVSDVRGRAVADAQVRIDHRGDRAMEARTDAEGFAVATMEIQELDYFEVSAACGDSESRVGFEAQPVYDGLGITDWAQSAEGVSAKVLDVTQRGGTRFDVRCGGVIRAMGEVPEHGRLSLSKDDFKGVNAGTSCVLQVVRGRFDAGASRTARVFQWGETPRIWEWQEHVDGIGREGLDVHARSLDADVAQISQWKASGYHRIRLGIATALALSLFLWFAFVLRGFRRRRTASKAQGDLAMEVSATTVSIGPQSALWLGWVALVVAYGGLYIVLMLMGL